MNIHEYGAGNDRCIVLIHPSLVMWDYFENIGHAGMTLLAPDLFAREIRRVISENHAAE